MAPQKKAVDLPEVASYLASIEDTPQRKESSMLSAEMEESIKQYLEKIKDYSQEDKEAVIGYLEERLNAKKGN